jgi:hypothetical protein
MSEKVYNGSCFCGAVEVTVTGVPAGMGYCHCASCREWSAGPVHAFTLWKPEQVYAAVLREFPFEPGVHIHYGETVLRIRDGAPKLKDLPKELGGTGQAVSE